MKKSLFERLIREFSFKELFIELGWDNFSNKLPIAVNEEVFELTGVVEKKGFVILHCPPQPSGNIPLSNLRKQIEKTVTKNYFEHLIIYSDKNKTQQIWQFIIKEENKPKQVREINWHSRQDVEILFQRLKNLLFTIDEEENLTLIDVKAKISENLAVNTETVTKKFYTEFKKQHSVFLDFIQGIDDHINNKENKNKQWYASLMLNRLMFCYFIQKKGFLNQDTNYLKNKLQESKRLEGNSNFYNFYRSFLLELFHDGLGKPIDRRPQELPIDMGKIPYLNGGLFDVHELEKQFNDINIDDEAFERIFNFFDQWNWHLDTNIEATGRDINPDVIGYIFEKYINDRAAMGAYYTKEDITEYIGKNTIIPFLFDETERHYKKAFKTEGTQNEAELWRFLKNSGDTYIYDAVKKGIPQTGGLFDDLPDEIKKGFNPDLEKKIVAADERPHLWEILREWNRKAPQDIALPTETYRELIERRKRYAEIKLKIENGEITQINDFITYNLNIRQFTQDFIESTEDAEFIRHFYKAIKEITILDPTAGSGAFLFAAMNILEPLYEACIMRMEQFSAEEPKKHKFFEDELSEVNSERHPNLKYYIFKNIILNNLYGVDIMKEAVEIAKLRLFLKLVAAVDVNMRKPNFGLEPLPDIDFNIRAGNTLVGFATEKELLETIQKVEGLFAKTKLEEFKEEFELVSTAYKRFQDAQLINNQGSETFKGAKTELNERIKELNRKLNIYLAGNYGITMPEGRDKQKYQNWLETHQPFHWFAEFYDIINGGGGFDVIIGNPPYVTFPNKSINYELLHFKSIKSSNLFSFCMERSKLLLNSYSKFSFIILMASITTKRMDVLRDFMLNNYNINWIINLAGDWHPGRLFEGVRSQFVIWNSSNNDNYNALFTTEYLRWYNEEREFLFNNIKYFSNNQKETKIPIKKIGDIIEDEILKKIKRNKHNIAFYKTKPTNNKFEYRNAGIAYYQIVLNFSQYFMVNGIRTKSTTLFPFFTNTEKENIILVSVLNSNTFSLVYFIYSDCYHLTYTDFNLFYIDVNDFSEDLYKNIKLYISSYIQTLNKTSILKKTNYKTKGEVIYQEFYPKYCKNHSDNIDLILAEHYGFTEEELDFIINYDIKYRMGKELDAYINGTLGMTK